jgi:hypothetical protein
MNSAIGKTAADSPSSRVSPKRVGVAPATWLEVLCERAAVLQRTRACPSAVLKEPKRLRKAAARLSGKALTNIAHPR